MALKLENLRFALPWSVQEFRYATNKKTQSLEFWDSDSDKIVTAESSDLKLVYKEVNETLLKATKLDLPFYI